MANRTNQSTLRLVLLALLVTQADGDKSECSSSEDTSLLQAKRGPQLEAETGEGKHNPNPWAQSAMKLYNHRRHDHNKVVDHTDYRSDAAEFYEKIKDQSLAERCPMLKIMNLSEVNARWKQALHQLKEEDPFNKHPDRALEDLKGEFANMLNHGKPVIVEGSVPKQLGWTAADHWGAEELSKLMADTPWDRSTFNYPDWIISVSNATTLGDYIKDHDSAKNIFLFASESGCKESPKLKKLVDKLRGQFAPSPEFGYGPEWCTGILAVDGIGSSHGFHCHDPVWNTQVTGTKHWWLLEPWYGSDMMDVDGLMEWGGAPKLPNMLDSQAFEYPNACAMLKEVPTPPGTYSCITKPGEMIILPDAWMHATCGLTEFTIAAGGWLGGIANED